MYHRALKNKTFFIALLPLPISKGILEISYPHTNLGIHQLKFYAVK